MSKLTHLDDQGRAQMVNVSDKPATARVAAASCLVTMKPGTLEHLQQGSLPKGDAWQVARLAGVMAAKQASQLIPLCHPIRLDGVEVELRPLPPNQVRVETRVTATDRTGVEMEALTAAAIAALTLYDMCKAVDREMVIGPLQLEEKRGGQHGEFVRKERAQ